MAGMRRLGKPAGGEHWGAWGGLELTISASAPDAGSARPAGSAMAAGKAAVSWMVLVRDLT